MYNMNFKLKLKSNLYYVENLLGNPWLIKYSKKYTNPKKVLSSSFNQTYIEILQTPAGKRTGRESESDISKHFNDIYW